MFSSKLARANKETISKIRAGIAMEQLDMKTLWARLLEVEDKARKKREWAQKIEERVNLHHKTLSGLISKVEAAVEGGRAKSAALGELQETVKNLAERLGVRENRRISPDRLTDIEHEQDGLKDGVEVLTERLELSERRNKDLLLQVALNTQHNEGEFRNRAHLEHYAALDRDRIIKVEKDLATKVEEQEYLVEAVENLESALETIDDNTQRLNETEGFTTEYVTELRGAIEGLTNRADTQDRRAVDIEEQAVSNGYGVVANCRRALETEKTIKHLRAIIDLLDSRVAEHTNTLDANDTHTCDAMVDNVTIRRSDDGQWYSCPYCGEELNDSE